jgi:iron complex outermembrane receptor protein
MGEAFAQQVALQEAVPQDPVVVTATRTETRLFDAPAAIGSVDAATIRAAGPMVNLSESLARVPGITVLNRQNFSQDLQLSVRGFGSRSTFGIRGVRLIVDGIPATMPDGQGQGSSVSLSSAERIEVLRGPLALLYGNAAGGVVQVFSEVGSPQPTVTFATSAGPYDSNRYDVKFSGSSGPHGYTVDVSRFSTDGYRDHSAASRDQLNAKWRWQWSDATRIDTVVNVLDQPVALDPLGLTRAQWEDNPRQSPAIALQQDAHKTLKQKQVGTVLEHRFDPQTTFVARLYAGQRELDNALSIPLAAQLPASSSGGIVDFDRHYSGAGVQLQRSFALAGVGVARLLAGFDYDRMLDDRQGYLNTNGVRGALRRDEDDKVANTDALLQASVDLGERWSAIAGVRSSRVRFETDDRYIAPGNPDDSGELVYRATNPVAGITWHGGPTLNVYANAGRGFETPTFTELAYRNVGSGINTGLKASRSRHLELGAKWRPTDDHALEAALFDIRTRDEIVVDTNVGGRSTFRNAGPTARRGAEISYVGRWSRDWRATLSLTALRARFDETVVSGTGAAAVTIARGNRLPGTPERSAFAELAYAPPTAWGGFNSAIEVVHVGRLYVNDANEDFAPRVTLLNLRAGLKLRVAGLEIEPLVRLENATDRRYAGSVIVNEANRRFFEPAPPRGWLAAVTARYRF